MDFVNIKGVSKIIVVLLLMLFVISFIGDYTGAAARGGGYNSGRFFSYKSPILETEIKVIGEGIDPNTNLPFIKSGGVINIEIWPGSNGVFSGAQVIKNPSGLRIAGDLCNRDKTLDFCSLSYQCLEKDKSRCGKGGPVCYGGKKISNLRLRSTPPGKYSVIVCDGTADCNHCKKVGADFLII